MFLWPCLCFYIDCIYYNDVIHCWSNFLSCTLHIGHVALYCFVLACFLQFHMLWALYLLWKYLSGFPKFFLLIHLLCVVILLLFLSVVMGSVFLYQLCWILLLDILSSHFLLLLPVLLSILIYFQILCGSCILFFFPVSFLVVLFIVDFHNTLDNLSIYLLCFTFFFLHSLL